MQAGDEECLREGMRMLSIAEQLTGDERTVMSYFLDNVSVGDIRAVLELEKKKVKEPEQVIARLIQMGLLERGRDAYNLAPPLRCLKYRRGNIKLQ